MCENENKCHFIREDIDGNLECGILECYCDGFNAKCSFYKTRQQYKDSRDRAIDRCRSKGLCRGCMYRKKPCVKSKE